MLFSRILGFCREAYRKSLSTLKILSWRMQGATIGRSVRLYGDIYVDGSLRNLEVGSGTTINHGVYLNCRAELLIGRDCNISAGVRIITTGLAKQQAGLKRNHMSSSIRIGNDVWIGAGATVLSGCSIVNDVTVGACSLVSNPIYEGGVYVGAPVRKVQ